VELDLSALVGYHYSANAIATVSASAFELAVDHVSYGVGFDASGTPRRLHFDVSRRLVDDHGALNGVVGVVLDGSIDNDITGTTLAGLQVTGVSRVPALTALGGDGLGFVGDFGASTASVALVATAGDGRRFDGGWCGASADGGGSDE